MSNEITVYLDTSKLRNLASKSKLDNDWKLLDKFIREKPCSIIISELHAIEFASGDLQNDKTLQYLSELPVLKWVIDPIRLHKREVEIALNFLLSGNKSKKIELFYDSLLDSLGKIVPTDIKYSLSQPKNIIEEINIYKKQRLDLEIKNALAQSAQKICEKRNDTRIWHNPNKVLQCAIFDYLPDNTASGFTVPKSEDMAHQLMKLPSDWIPSLRFINKLQRIKFGFKNMNITVNDLIDEYHACYTPYCDVVMHDKGLCSRARHTKFEFANRITATPKEIFSILNEIADNEKK